MKRILITVCIFIFVLSGCKTKAEDSKSYFSSCGIWLSYYEVGDMLKSSNGLQNELDDLIKNCKEIGVEEVYIHVRSHCDSLFLSDYFPINENAKIYDYDVFEYMISEFHKNSIKANAWINPYRVSTESEDINLLNKESPAYKWLTDTLPDNDKNVCFSDGIYLNPASEDVQILIINGVKEIVDKYDVDGVVFDDYFYPTIDKAFDSLSYESYKSATQNPLKLEDWRRTNVNLLISGCYNAIKNKNENISFSVSPSHSIDRNYSDFYADVKYWVENGVVDKIIPQLYFGFEYPEKKYRFDELLKSWKNIVDENSNVELLISLPAYKIGTDSKADYKEWNTETDILSRQAEICFKDDKIDGFVIFSYSSLFSKEELNTKQRNNLKDAVRTFELPGNKNG